MFLPGPEGPPPPAQPPAPKRPSRPKTPAARTRAATPISDGLRAAAVNSRMTPYAVAQAAGVAPSVVTRWLSGHRSLKLDTADRIASALGLKLVKGGKS